ncbi:MAG: toast rack family protein [Candidatus Cyclobacteriaceae bacterium M3_2C_046]
MPVYKRLLILPLFLFLFSCSYNGDESREHQHMEEEFDLNQLDILFLDLAMKAGELEIRGNSANRFSSDFYFSYHSWRPDISFAREGHEGHLTVAQNALTEFNLDDQNENRWQVRIPSKVPVDLKVNVGAGQSHLDLANLTIRKAVLETGAGETHVNLSGTSIPEMYMNAGVGEVKLDLTGSWQNNGFIEIKGGIGELSINVPEDVGVSAKIKGMLGDIKARDFRKEEGLYRNQAYGHTENTIFLDISAGIGSVQIYQK